LMASSHVEGDQEAAPPERPALIPLGYRRAEDGKAETRLAPITGTAA
jgi:hypothetical protein